MGKTRCREFLEPKKKSEDCVKNIITRIIKVQDEAMEDSCFSACDSAIQQLRKGNSLGPVNTTIPFILYCEDCKPFMGSGVFQAPMGKKSGNFFGSAETPILRAKHFVKDSDCCIRVELLLPITEKCRVLMPEIDCCSNTIAPFFSIDDPVTGFQETGICITIDVEKFIGITCLDPITPIQTGESPSSHSAH
ncbi:CotY/CotZ family spore coat protein [Virgibacillus oceani]